MHFHSSLSFQDKFIAFKTPLSAEYDRSLEEQYRFYPSMLLSYVQSAGRRMGLIIDLTKTDRYYDKRELMEHSIGHHKIVCEGYILFYIMHILYMYIFLHRCGMCMFACMH